MKSNSVRKLIQISIVLLFVAIALHGYLAYKHFEISYGSAEPSICNINSKFDCDSVNASPYGELFGIPIAIWGGATNAVLILLLLGGMLLQSPAILRQSFWLSLGIALVSVVMGAISTLLIGTYCLFCVGIYVISFVVFALVWKVSPKPILSNLVSDLSGARWFWGLLISIPIVVWLTNGILLKSFQADGLGRYQKTALLEWQNNPVVNFQLNGQELSKGAPAESAKVTLIEFADFRCSHCKDAAPKLNLFVKAHPDTRLVYLFFPLDGECNQAIPQSVGASCKLAKAVLCANQQGKGWDAHGWIFDHQTAMTSTDAVNTQVQKMVEDLGLQGETLKTCMDNPATHEEIRRQAKMGADADIGGTPTIFLNGRKLPGAQILPILNSAYEEAKK